MLVEDHAVMPEVVELELFDCRVDFLTVVPLVEHTQSQHKHGVICVDAGQ